MARFGIAVSFQRRMRKPQGVTVAQLALAVDEHVTHAKKQLRADHFVGVKRRKKKKGREIKSRNPLNYMVGTE
ncbi:hypothetical protein QZH46_02815 [Pseudomonas corrugata]